MKSTIIFILTFFFSVLSVAQIGNIDTLNREYGNIGIKDGQQYVITRIDGIEYIGKILSDDGHEILINTKALGNVYIPKFEVKSIVEVKDEKSIKYDYYQPEGPFTTRYSFTTNALPIKKGQNYGMLNLYGPEVHFALTGKFNLGIMTTWAASPLVLAMKYSFKEDISKVNFSFGTLIATTGYINAFKGFGGLHWLNITLGDRKNNFTFSGGYAYLQTGFEDEEPAAGVYTEQAYNLALENNSDKQRIFHGPIISFAGLFKIGGRASFIFDSMFGYFSHEIASSDYNYDSVNDLYTITVTRNNNAHSTALFLMPGVRFQNTDRRALQICVAGVSTFGDSDYSFPIPMISWFFKF